MITEEELAQRVRDAIAEERAKVTLYLTSGPGAAMSTPVAAIKIGEGAHTLATRQFASVPTTGSVIKCDPAKSSTTCAGAA